MKRLIYILPLMLLCACSWPHRHKSTIVTSSLNTMNGETAQINEFVQHFFVDSVFQREHVNSPLILHYSAEQNVEDESSQSQKSVLIQKNQYQVLALDKRSEIKFRESGRDSSIVVVSIPDTALEAELYFLLINDQYFLQKIIITGDTSPFL